MSQKSSPNEAIEQLFELYADEIYRFALYSVPRTVDARDVVQEVFLRAYRAWGKFRQDANPRTWLFQIARNYIYDLLRKKRVERQYLEKHKPDLSDVSVSLDTLIELEEVVADLPPDKRQVFVLRGIQDFSVQETAQILGWTQSKVKTTFHRAVQDLRVALTKTTQADLNQKEGEKSESQRRDDSAVFPSKRSKA